MKAVRNRRRSGHRGGATLGSFSLKYCTNLNATSELGIGSFIFYPIHIKKTCSVKLYSALSNSLQTDIRKKIKQMNSNLIFIKR